MSNCKKIVGFSKYGVTTCGSIVNLKTGRSLKAHIGTTGYYQVCMVSDSGEQKTKKVHRLVAETYLGATSNSGQEFVVDHIDNNRLNNHLNNLRIITNRENTTPKNSKLMTGVSFYEGRKKPYRATLKIKNKTIHIGYFVTEIEAHNAYKEKVRDFVKTLK